MSFWQKLKNSIFSPKIKWLIPFYLLTVIVIAGSITFAIIGFNDALYLQILAYVSFALSALCLAYVVYTIVIFAPRIKRRLVKWLSKSEFMSKMMNTYGFRTAVFTLFSMSINALYVVYMCYMAISGKSIWFGVLTGYYFIIAVMRAMVLRGRRKSSFVEDETLYKIKVYRDHGILFILLSLALAVAVTEIVINGQVFPHANIVIYALALYAFWKITNAIINLIKAKRQDDMTIRALRNICFADALVSILSLQTALLWEFSSGSGVAIANALSGSAVCIFTFIMGVFVICRAYKFRKYYIKLRDEQKNKEE